jgi:RNA polymerase sigma-70 factor (ECF subfamily)
MRAELPAARAAALPAPTRADDAVLEAIAALRESDREVLLLSAWEGLSPTQIAAVLGISPLAVRSRLHRARARVQERLGRPADGPASVPSALEPENAR